MLDIFFFDQNGLAIKKRIKILLMCVTGFNLPLCIPTLCGPIQKSLIDKIFFEKKNLKLETPQPLLMPNL